MPAFLQRSPGYDVDISDNLFTCPLPLWCGSEGNSKCAPCVILASPSPIALDKNSSNAHPLPTEEGHQPSLGWMLAAGIGFLCVILIALAAVLAFVYRSYFVRRFQPLPSGLDGDDAL